ncbi:hypothetical protein G6F35_015832 [Rhizopus arrhizus]|nr:hypothetical protein G6F35_015832 [Rhizopus arrhizus]
MTRDSSERPSKPEAMNIHIDIGCIHSSRQRHAHVKRTPSAGPRPARRPLRRRRCGPACAAGPAVRAQRRRRLAQGGHVQAPPAGRVPHADAMEPAARGAPAGPVP